MGTHEGSPYVVSELLEGEPLRDRLDRGPLSARKVGEFALQEGRFRIEFPFGKVLYETPERQTCVPMRDAAGWFA